MTLRHILARHAIAAALTGAALAAVAPVAAQANERCVGIAEQHLQDLGVNKNSIERTGMVTDYLNLEMGTIRRIEAWTTFKSCEGTVVTKMSSGCRIVETYDRGNCRIEDLARK